MTDQNNTNSPNTPDPTNEAEARVTPRPFREEQAWQEIGNTTFAPGIRNTLIAGFLGLITVVPVVQILMPRTAYAALAGKEAATEAAVDPNAVTVTATVKMISAPPETGGVYNDFLMQIHATDITAADGSAIDDRLIICFGMREREILPSAAIRPGDRLDLQLVSWDSVQAEFGGMNGSVLEGDDYLLMERQFAAGITVEGANSLPSGRDFMASWAGVGSDLPPEHRVGVFSGTGTAWSQADGILNKVLDGNGHLAKRISLYETALDDASWLALTLKSPVQGIMAALGVGNEKAIIGRDGWLFYTPGVESLTKAGFLESSYQKHRTRTSTDQPDPRLAILDLRDQLQARGIELLLVPAPIKPSIHPEYLTSRLDGSVAVRNPSVSQFFQEMADNGVHVYDPLPLLMERKAATGEAQYLKTDTHWSPEAMQAIAAAVADKANEIAQFTGPTVAYTSGAGSATQFGDIATMLEMPDWQSSVSEETANIQGVVDPAGKPWRAAEDAEVMLLGDSFTNIYHLGPMGWGADAGFAEHISLNLGRPLDVLSQNDAGARASRQLLVDALTTNPGRLQNTKVVIWEFAERELALGNWELMQLPEAGQIADPIMVDNQNDAAAVQGDDKPEAQPAAQEAEAQEASEEQPVAAAAAAAAAGDLLTPETAAAAFKAIADQAKADGKPAIAGKDEWLHLTAELRHLGAGKFWGDAAADEKSDPLHSIVDFKNKLEELGIDFILAPVPPRAIVYADTVLDNVPVDEHGVPVRLDGQLQAFYSDLEDAGVTVVDVTDAFLEARRTDAENGPVCCPQDTHWSARGLELAAELVVDAIGEAEWLEDVAYEGAHVQEPEALTYVGDLVKRVDENADSTTDSKITKVTADEGGNTDLEFNSTAPVLLLSDSHGLVFSAGKDMHSTSAGFGEWISGNLGFAIDRISRRGSGDTVRVDLARRFLQKPADAEQKRVVIYTFAARTFTEFNSWKVVPLKR